MNGPCSLHTSLHIERAAQTVEAWVATSPRPLQATRKTVYQRYCEDLAINGETAIYYDDTKDLLDIAHQCAATIMADQCPMYVVAEPVIPGSPRIIKREILEKYPNRYEQITG